MSDKEEKVLGKLEVYDKESLHPVTRIEFDNIGFTSSGTVMLVYKESFLVATIPAEKYHTEMFYPNGPQNS